MPSKRFFRRRSQGLSALCAGLLGALSIAMPSQALVISELMYHSEAVSDRADEFIELYNENIDPIDLSGYSFCNGVAFTFPRGTYLDGHSYLVVCADEAAVQAKYGIDNTIGDYVGSLSNDGERLELCNSGGIAILEVDYNDRGKWPSGADGTGHSLELKSPFLETDDPDNWRLSRARGGSPGEPNGPAFESGGDLEPPPNGMDSQGFVLTWLCLGPYTGSACSLGAAAIQADWLSEGTNGPARQTGLVWRDGQQVRTQYTTAARSTGLHANAGTATPTIREHVSFSDTINLNDNVYPPNPENVMAYSFAYVDNVTGANLIVDIGCASDDAIAVMVNGAHVWVNDACRGVGGAGVIQDTIEDVTLEPGKNLVAVKCFENGGGWSFRLRFQERNTTTPITSIARIQITTDVDAGMDFNGGGTPIQDPGEEPPEDPPPGEEPGASPVLINEGLLWTAGSRWIELYNRSAAAVDLSGYYLTDDPGFLTKARIPNGTSIAAGGYVSFTDAQLGLDFSVAPPGEIGDRKLIVLVAPSGEQVLDAYNFEPELAEMSEARVPDGDSEFEGAAEPTRDAANLMSVNSDVVINEVMYHPIDGDPDKEYIELYNRGAAAVDLSGWAITRGVEFVFPAGAAIAAGGYLVVARNPRRIEAIHGLPAGSVLGPEQTSEGLDAFRGLRDSGERITLKDAMGRTVDTIRFRDGGEWPRWPDGLGSSLELIDPFQDNRFGQAWDASDDSDKAPVEHFSYVGRHRGGESELAMLLNTRGITIVDNVSIVGGALQNNDVPLIDVGEVWRYFKGTAAPPANWNQLDFDPAAAGWLSGATGIGYGDGDDATELTDMQGSYRTIFCVKDFNVSDVGAIDDLVLSITIDDGFYAYINGQQVASHNVASAAWNADAPAAGEPNLQERTLATSVLRVGRNVLAVQVHNAGLGSSDLSFIPRLVSRTTEFTAGSEQVVNGRFEADVRGWIIEGTHIRSGRTTIDPIAGAGSLKIIASGRGDNKVNRLETPDASGFGLGILNTNEDLQISFDARWVVGSQTLLTHGYEHAMAKSHPLAVPENLGTPGRTNSVTQRQIAATGAANLGPVITDVFQDPAVPGDNEIVTVYARVHDPDGVQNVRIRYALNNPSASPLVRTMTSLGGGLYRGTVPGQLLGTKVVFFITAEDGGGRPGRYPLDITQRTHPLVLDPRNVSLNDHRYLIYQHDARLPSTPYHSYRFWMTDADLSTLETRRLLSNDLIPGSFVYGASTMYYESHTRFSGSPFARGGIGGSYRVAMRRDQWLHERVRKMNLDNHHGNGLTANERVSHYLIRLNQGGISVPYSEIQTMVRWQLNNRVSNTLEHTWVPDVQYLSLWFPGDDDGDFYEVDDRFVIDDNGGRRGNANANVRYPPPSSTSDGNGANQENYRWFFTLRAKNGADDFRSLIELARVMDPSVTSDAAFDAQVWDLVNVEEFLRIWAVRLNTADWDQWSGTRGKNCYLYRPPRAGRFELFAWDMELTYGDVNSFLIPAAPTDPYNPGSFAEVNRMLNRTKVKRIWYGILNEMVNGPESWFGSAYLSQFMSKLAAIGMANTGIGQPGGFIDRRADLLRTRIASVVSTAFAITTNSGRDFSTSDLSVDIAGNSPAQVCQILVSGEPYEVVFTGLTTWRIDGVQLHPGANFLELVGFDLRGDIAGTDSITVTNTLAPWNPPAITRLEPASAPAGADIEVVGSDFHNGVRVLFGATESPDARYDESGATSDRIVAEVPSGTGTVAVKVRNVDGQESNTVNFTYTLPPAVFVRGEVNGDGRVDISDGVKVVLHLFRGVAIDCQDAADANDDESLNVTDVVYLLDHMYRGGPAPAAPYPSRGPDPAGAALGCSR